MLFDDILISLQHISVLITLLLDLYTLIFYKTLHILLLFLGVNADLGVF